MQVYSGTTALSQSRLASVLAFFDQQQLAIDSSILTEKPTQKWLKSVTTPSVLIDDEGRLSLVADGMKVSPNWQGQQQRVVKAGKKSELLLKVAKLGAGMHAIDATAGFGHDSLILASTGAQVTMVEENPVMYLLLQAEIDYMQTQVNWQRLLSRLSLRFGRFEQLAKPVADSAVDVVLLDPMFPDNSYKSAQVNKNMQVLHRLALPPTQEDEQALLAHAMQWLSPTGKVIVKRPKHAPFLAAVPPIDSIHNDLIRFDSYSRFN